MIEWHKVCGATNEYRAGLEGVLDFVALWCVRCRYRIRDYVPDPNDFMYLVSLLARVTVASNKTNASRR